MPPLSIPWPGGGGDSELLSYKNSVMLFYPSRLFVWERGGGDHGQRRVDRRIRIPVDGVEHQPPSQDWKGSSTRWPPGSGSLLVAVVQQQ